MWQAQVEQEDIRLEAERRVKYRGTARIKLKLLYFRPDESRELDKGHVEYLKQCFKKEGCRPLEVSHHILAEID
jgi:tagatose-1,6-bisphosphate aldolase